MKYPYLMYSPEIDIKPVFNGLKSDPLIVDLSSTSPLYQGIDVRDQKKFQKRIEQLMGKTYSWGVASYLENRETALSTCPQMMEEKRFFHLGLDIIVELGLALHAPLDATVVESSYEAGDANYGGFVVLKHESQHFETFYSLYGHLCKDRLPEKNRQLKAGEAFAEIGDFHENGNWFYHTHLQVITQKGIDNGFLSKGYCSVQDLDKIDGLCPSPLPLFKAW